MNNTQVIWSLRAVSAIIITVPIDEGFYQKIYNTLDFARLAPSVHNSQPWRVKITGSGIVVSIDRENAPTLGDPTGRETVISLGIFCEAVVIAAGSNGLAVSDVKFTKDKAVLAMVASQKKPTDSLQAIKNLRYRCTDRSIYKRVPVTKQIIRELEGSYSAKGLSIKAMTDDIVIQQTASLTARGIGLALTSPDFRNELSRYLVYPWSHKKRGISVFSLRIPKVLEVLEPLLIRHGILLKTEVRTELKRWRSASGIIFITTAGDLHNDWFEAGRAYLRTSLVAESYGLSQATSAATVEASTYHEDIEKILNTKQRLQCVTRMGRGSTRKVFSPRAPVEDLLVT